MGNYDADAIANAPIYGSGNYFQPGKYKLVIKEVKIIDSQRKSGTQYAIVACTIIETTAETLRPEDNVTWRVDMTQKSGPSNLKQFSLAVGQALYEGFTEEHIDGNFVRQLFGPQSPAEGLVINADAIIIKTNANTDFTKVVWAAPEAA